MYTWKIFIIFSGTPGRIGDREKEMKERETESKIEKRERRQD